VRGLTGVIHCGPMKTLLACFCLLGLTAIANEGSPPQPTGVTTRFTIVSGQVDYGSGPQPIFMRLDTFTGQSWALQAVPMPNGAIVHIWVYSQEMGGDLYKLASKALQEKVDKKQ